MINFNEPPVLGNESEYIKDAIDCKHISGDGKYTKLVNRHIQEYTMSKCSLVVNSGTAALEMAALLLEIQPGDEVICPSYTFVTTVSAFALRGAKIVFVDIREDTANIDESKIEAVITPRTKAIIVVHYGGVACEMNTIMAIAAKYCISIVEDAAQAIGSKYNGVMCGSIADIGCYSFHETKNISCGEGGAIIINDEKYVEDAEIIREKGTNRSKFFRGQVDKYTWVKLGSSFLPSDMISAYLYAQLKEVEKINNRRLQLWNCYYDSFEELAMAGKVVLPYVPKECCHNAHMFYLKFDNLERRTKFIEYMKSNGVNCVFHYVPLHSSPAGIKYGEVRMDMSVTNKVSQTLVRLPLYYNMDDETQRQVIYTVLSFF